MKNTIQQRKRYAVTKYEGVIFDRVTEAFYKRAPARGAYVKVSDGFGEDRIKVKKDQIGPESKLYTFWYEDGKKHVMNLNTGVTYCKVEDGTNQFKMTRRLPDPSVDPVPELITLSDDEMEPAPTMGDNEVMFEDEKVKLYTVNGTQYKDDKKEDITWKIERSDEDLPYWVKVAPSTVPVAPK